MRALVEGLAPEDAQVLSFDFSIMNSFDYALATVDGMQPFPALLQRSTMGNV